MSEPQPSNGAETNGAKPAPAGLESLAAVGSRLAQLRETRGWTVDDVSARLKVAPQKLRALEAGDISHLPGVTFALGVVRSYAKMLGVDPEVLVDRRPQIGRGKGPVDRMIGFRVCCTNNLAHPHAATGDQDRHRIAMMSATGTAGLFVFHKGRAAKFARHHDHDFLVESSSINVFHQRGDALIVIRIFPATVLKVI